MSTDTRFEKAPEGIVERLARLEEHKQTVATKEDISDLKGLIGLNKLDLDKSFELAVTSSENTTLKKVLKNWAIIAGLVFPLLTGLIVALLNALLNS